MSEKPVVQGSSPPERGKRGKRRVVVELYCRAEGGRLVANGTVVAEYVDGRRGGAVREVARDR